MNKFSVIHVIIKVTEVCNLACKHCYFFEHGDKSYIDDPHLISRDMIGKISTFLAAGAKELGLKELFVTFHGGEPLMLGKRRFDDMCKIIRASIEPVTKLTLTMQTNGTLLDEEWLNILCEHRIGIGISFDGPRQVHDALRIDKRGKGSYDDVLRAIGVLNEGLAHGLDCGYGVGAVVDVNSDASEVLDHMVEILKEGILEIRPMMMDWTNYNGELAKQTAAYYRKLVHAWTSLDNPALRLKFPSFVLAALLSDVGAESSARVLLNRCLSMTVRSNGDLCPDDAIVPKDPRYRFTGHNVTTSSLSEFLNAEFWENMRLAMAVPHPDCQECRWLGICRGGPLEERYLGGMRYSAKTVYCEMRKTVFEELYRYVTDTFGRPHVDSRLLRARSMDNIDPMSAR